MVSQPQPGGWGEGRGVNKGLSRLKKQTKIHAVKLFPTEARTRFDRRDFCEELCNAKGRAGEQAPRGSPAPQPLLGFLGDSRGGTAQLSCPAPPPPAGQHAVAPRPPHSAPCYSSGAARKARKELGFVRDCAGRLESHQELKELDDYTAASLNMEVSSK